MSIEGTFKVSALYFLLGNYFDYQVHWKLSHLRCTVHTRLSCLCHDSIAVRKASSRVCFTKRTIVNATASHLIFKLLHPQTRLRCLTRQSRLKQVFYMSTAPHGKCKSFVHKWSRNIKQVLGISLTNLSTHISRLYLCYRVSVYLLVYLLYNPVWFILHPILCDMLFFLSTLFKQSIPEPCY